MPVLAVTATFFSVCNFAMMFLKRNINIFKRVAEHIQKDINQQVSLDDIYNAYKMYCTATPTVLSVAEKKTIGKLVN